MSKNKSDALTCNSNRCLMMTRHHAIRDIVLKLIKSVAPGESAKSEQIVGRIVTQNLGRPDSVSDVITDILWERAAMKHRIDVKVTAEQQQSMLAYPYLSHVHQDNAAIYSEQQKHRHYRKVNQIDGESASIPEDSVIPFVVESTGRLGPAAFSFLNMLCATQTYKRNRYIIEIALACARLAGKMLLASRDRCAGQSHYRG